MPFATGPWHTPPQLPDDPEELCLVLLFRMGGHHSYAAMRHGNGWYYQDGRALEPVYWVSRWAYITSSVERMSELPPVAVLPVESRLFAPDALSEAERLRLLLAYVEELKSEVQYLSAALEDVRQGPSAKQWAGKLRALEHERDAQVAAQRAKVVALQKEVQELTRQLATADKAKTKAAQKAAQVEKQLDAQVDKLKLEVERSQRLVKAPPSKADQHSKLVASTLKVREQERRIADLEHRLRAVLKQLEQVHTPQ
ncbi:MAG: hypothetical protein JNM62_00095 [Flavobacteriales bacterium]|nr:hypothetical protein [Flavobacteriales bacterium]